MSISAASIAPNIDGVAEAISACTTAIIANDNRLNMELGNGIQMGMQAFSDAYAACCSEQIEGQQVSVPPAMTTTTTTNPDGSSTTVTQTTPGYDGPYQGYQAFAQQQAWDNQTGTFSANYQQYLSDVNDWQDTQYIPIILALLANLAVVLDQLKLYNEMLDCVNDLLDCVKSEVESLKALSQDTLIPAVELHTDNLMEKFASAAALTAVCDQRDGITARATTMWDCFENTYKPELTQYYADFAGQMFSNAAAGSEQQIELRDLNRLMRQCFEDYIKPEDSATAPVLGEHIRTMTDKLDDACDWLTDCADKLEGHWDTAYAQKDVDYACAAMESATEALNGVANVRTFLQGCRDSWKAIHTSVYHAKEAQHVPELHQAALDTVGKFDDVAMCAFECSEDEKARYMTTYEAKENALSTLAMNEACELVPCFSDIKDWLIMHSDDLQACWDPVKVKEMEHACQQLEKGIDVICKFEEELEEFCVCVDSFKTHWEDCYKQAECAVNPKLILAATPACEKQQTTYGKLCEHMDHLWDKFDRTWCAWDEQDAQEFCDFWLSCNPLDELKANSECQQELADLLKGCYQDIVLPWEKAYIQEICDMERYEASYCEWEDSAMLHIRKQGDVEAERAIKSNPRYCSGATKQQLININNANLRLQAAAMATANRDERWWEVQEADRRHRYTMEVLERLGKRFPDHALQFYAGSSEIMDSILARMHERLLRGYEYVRNTNDYGRSVLNSTAQAIDAGQRGIQQGQFYPDLYTRGKSEYLRHSDAFVDNTNDSIRLAQLYPQLASQDRERAVAVINQSGQLGYRHMEHGHRHIETALQAKRVTADTAQSAQANALRSYAIGQDYLRIALAAQNEDTSQTNVASQSASNAQRIGATYAELASNKMETILQGALTAMREGNSMMGNNRLFAAQIQNGYEAVVTGGLNGFNRFMDSQRIGLATVDQYRSIDGMSLQAAMNMQSSACDFLSRNHAQTASVAAQANSGALGTATGLLSGAAQGITSGVDGFIGSLGALNTPPTPPTVPAGNQFTFGSTNAITRFG